MPTGTVDHAPPRSRHSVGPLPSLVSVAVPSELQVTTAWMRDTVSAWLIMFHRESTCDGARGVARTAGSVAMAHEA